MGIGSKLSKLMEIKNTNANELARNIDVSPQTIYSIIKRDSKKADIEVLLKIADTLGVTAEYFVDEINTDTGSNLEQYSKEELVRLKQYHDLDPLGRSHVDTVLQWETERVKQIEQATPATVIELSTRYGSRHLSEYFRDASAGGGIFILGNEAASKIAIADSDWDERTDYVIRVNGDSMMPDFQDGDNVMVSQRVELHHGDVGIFVVNGKAYIKEYGAEELISRNPDSPNISIHEYDNIVCMGKVIGKLDGGYEIIND